MKIKPICEKCGKRPSIGRILVCRYCYDKARMITSVAIPKKYEENVKRLMADKDWKLPRTMSYLVKAGLKYIEMKEKEMGEKWEI